MEFTFGRMAIDMRESGEAVSNTDLGQTFLLMEMFILGAM